MALSDDQLREAAVHRGLKLVKSRRRKPGVGDYGLFGLTDSAGGELFGFSPNGLTASAEQIADFLRKGEASTWAASAKQTPARAKSAPAARPQPVKPEEDVPSALGARPRRSAAAMPEPVAGERRHRSEADRRRKDRAAQAEVASPSVGREPKKAATLRIRSARPSDAAAVHRLLSLIGFEGGVAEARRAIADAGARKEPVLVADRAGILGCLAWHILPTIQQGRVARITAMVVEEEERRRGVGRELYQAALAEFQRRKARSVEAMSPIEVRNANGFYRALGLKQDSYRFATDV